MKRRVLDTDTLTAFFRGRPEVLRSSAEYLRDFDHLTISIVTFYEVLRGLRFISATRQFQDLKVFERKNEILPLSREAVEHAASIYCDLRSRGVLVGEADILIAGIAVSSDAVLVTNNVRHFSRIRGLEVENWIRVEP